MYNLHYCSFTSTIHKWFDKVNESSNNGQKNRRVPTTNNDFNVKCRNGTRLKQTILEF